MQLRLGYSVAAHLEPDVLLVDEALSVGDAGFQHRCFEHMAKLVGEGRTLVLVTHDMRAVESLCDRAILLRHGGVEYDGEAHEALRRYQAMLAAEEAPAERSAGLREWGTGEVRVTRATLEGADGGERHEFGADEPVVLRIWVASEAAMPPPELAVELRDSSGGLLGSHVQSTADLGWDGAPGERQFRFELERLPVIDGRFQFGIALLGSGGEPTYHRVEKAAELVVNPAVGMRGWVRFSGRFILDETASMVTVR
jgi:lipopolysaccharide transport system ATP-binding protein